ncbi:RHS repeat-associated core domain-containing protein, partial [Streptomyces sp. NPDC021100]|uniref:RHS repeat-associated core domain-containing protein n=1 Tax=Streptomyces sp. NPDC021100 TaxID=3365114 RepID=UPI003794E49B
ETGTTAWRSRATLWGTTAWPADSTTYTPLRFPGQYFDPEAGLHYNFHRSYDPETARYLQVDPLGLAVAPNASTYVHNPHRYIDPLGLAPECSEAQKRRGTFDFRPPNPEHPPDASAVEAMQRVPIGGNIDCSEIAEWIMRDSQGDGHIINFTTHPRGAFTVPEKGGTQLEEYIYHDVYTDGKYVYDPAMSKDPIPAGDFERAIRLSNPGKKIVTGRGGYDGPLW